MKAKQLASLYNDEQDKSRVFLAIQDNFTREFERIVLKQPAFELKDMAQVYCKLEIKWMAFALRTNNSIEFFKTFMLAAFPFEIERIHKFLTTTAAIDKAKINVDQFSHNETAFAK